MRISLVALLFYVAAYASPFAAALFRVWVNQDAVQLGYELSEQTHQRAELRQTRKQLEVELAAERTPGHLMDLAHRLGMNAPTAGQLVSRAETSR